MYETLSTTLLVLAFLGVAALTTWLLNKYTSRKLSSWYVLILVWIGWYFSFIVVVLVPLDISSTSHKECEVTETSCTEPWINVHRNSLIYIWNTVYWTTYILCWTGYPFIQSYVTDGSFTVSERIKAAIKENLIFYGICLGVVIVLFLWMIAKTQGNYQDIYATAIAAANAWGLFLLISLLGYGLVEIPRKIWQESDREMTMKFYQFDAVNKRQDFEDAKIKYYETLKLIKKYSEKTRSTDAFRPYIDTIESECPPEYRQIKSGEGDFELRYDKIVQLRKRLQFVIHELRRSQGLYQVRLERAFALEDIMRSRKNSVWTIDWSFKPKRKGYFAKQINALEFLWKVYLETLVFKFLSIICVLLSLAVVWSEVVFSVPKVNLSIFSILLNVQTQIPFLWQWFVVGVPVTYITICACWSLFQFRLFNFYRLVPHQETDANSLLFSAAYLCRLIAPIAYNFTLMVHNDTTAFYDVLGQMNLTPFLGNEYNVYFPMILIILCIANYFNLFSKFILTCCIKRFHRFVFEEGISDKPIAQGKEILKHERELWERGINSSHVNVNTDAQERKGKFPDFKKMFHPRATSQDTENLLGRQKRPYGTSAPEDPYADFNNGIV